MRTGERVAALRNALGLSQTQLAKAVGLSQATIGKLESGISSGSSHLHRIAIALNTTASYLAGETDDPSAGALPVPTPQQLAEQFGMSLIPEIGLGFALGGGAFVDGHIESKLVPFRKDWLDRLTRYGPSDVFLTRGDGDSMMPTILDEDDVLVNRADNLITRQDRIWALAYGDLATIKRVRRTAQGTFLLMSDNTAVSPIEATEEEIHVVGRVIWIGRKM
jgi:phage repressor protein C with HTH and peptisase S24 domain